MVNWLPHLPENCPPPEADDATGEFYRLVDRDPPHPKDFLSWREKNMGKDLPQGMTECQAGGVSIFQDEADACRLIKKVPRFRKSKLAVGALEPSLGKVLHTPSTSSKSHHTWWIPVETKPWTVFQIVNVE